MNARKPLSLISLVALFAVLSVTLLEVDAKGASCGDIPWPGNEVCDAIVSGLNATIDGLNNTIDWLNKRIDSIQAQINTMWNYATVVLPNFAANFPANVQAIVNGIIELIAQLRRIELEVLTNLPDKISTLTGHVGDLLTYTTDIADKLRTLEMQVIQELPGHLTTLVTLTNDVGGDLLDLATNLDELNDYFIDGIDSTIGSLGDHLTDANDLMKVVFDDLTTKSWQMFTELLRVIEETDIDLEGLYEQSTAGFGSLGTILSGGFSDLQDKVSEYGSRLETTANSIVPVGDAVAEALQDPDRLLSSLAQTQQLLPILSDLFLALLEFTAGTAELSAEVIDQLPEIVETLPGLAQFYSQLPALQIEMGTQLIENVPQIVQGLPDLLSTKLTNLFKNISEDPTVLLNLVASVEELDKLSEISDQTTDQIQAKVDEIEETVTAGFQALFELVGVNAQVLASENDGTGLVTRAQLQAMQAQIDAAMAFNAALREEHERLTQEPSFDGDPVKALNWLIQHESPEVQQRLQGGLEE